jgi:hypothetical protein
MNKHVLWASIALVSLAASPAAASVKFCLDADTSFVDNGFGEAYWGSDSARDMRGARIKIVKSGVTLWNGPVGDGLGTGDAGGGCTGTLSPASDNGSYTITAWTDADVNSNSVRVFQYPGVVPYSASTVYNNTGGAGTKSVVIPTNATNESAHAFNTFMAAAYAVWRHNAGMSGKAIEIKYDESYNCVGGTNDGAACTKDSQCTGGGDCFRAVNENRGGFVLINVNGQDNKFEIVHEVGHRVGALAVGARMGGAPYDADPGLCVDEPSGEKHSMRSLEYQEAAFGEGFAHFFSADVWNDHDLDTCQFRYYKQIFVPPAAVGGTGTWVTPTVDCESGTANFPEAYLDHEGCVANQQGRGVELDWMRMFWDLHKGSSAISMSDIVAWLKTSRDWDGTKVCVYQYLDAGAPGMGSTFNKLWNTAASDNGIDHPISPCTNASCTCF